MRVLIAEKDHAPYRQLLQRALPTLELIAADGPELAAQAGSCQVWLGEPDRFAELMRAGHKPDWVQSTWAGITPLLVELFVSNLQRYRDGSAPQGLVDFSRGY